MGRRHSWKAASAFQDAPIIGAVKLPLVESPLLRVHQSEKDLGQSLCKSTQLVILQTSEQLGLKSPRLQDMAMQEQVPSVQGTPGAVRTAQRPRAGPNPAPWRNKHSLSASRIWVTGWLCCVIVSITPALSDLDFSAELVDNPCVRGVKASCPALTAASCTCSG